MENEFILADAGIQPPTITEMQSWQSPHPDSLFHTNGWDAHSFNPMLSSPAGSNPPYVSSESSLIRELIGKLGGFGGNPAEIVGTSCYSTPLSSQPKLENSVAAGVHPNFAEFSADPGFVERAARFSCFGSRSFNDRTGAYVGGRVEFHQGHFPAAAAAGEVKLGRVSSSPSLNGLGQGSRPRIEIGGPLRSLDRIHSMESPEEESSVIEPVLSGETGPRGSGEMNPRKRKGVSNRGKTKEPANAAKVIQGMVNSSENSSAKRCKSNEGDRGDDRNKKEGEGEGEGVGEAEEMQNKIEAKPAEPPKDYIHVRARRGQATDSHSLAERVRREKISERMKLLQDLVPGCNKVTGKALMLDEIINYVQSLQRQVEFLSMKLASVNTSLEDVHSDSLLSKDPPHMFPSNNTLTHHMFPGDSPSTAATTDLHGRHHHHHPHRPLDSHFTPPSNLQYQVFSSGGDELHSIVQMGLGGHQDTTTSFQHQIFHY